MATKRKRTTATTASEPTEARRSSRRRATNGAVVPHRPLQDPADTEKDSKDKVGKIWESKEDVARAKRELGEMEQKLQKVVRTQRLAVENSDLQLDEELEHEAALRPEPAPSAKAVINGRNNEEKDAVELAPMDTEQAEEAHLDVAKAKAEEDEGTTERGPRRPPPINSDRLPLPWKGRLGYACLNTYLRTSTPPVFSSRTCRIASIIEHRHPLQDPSQPEHATKNRPDKEKPADVERGMKFVQELGLANARDIIKMLYWNDKYGIKFMRLSSEMFPFASHDEYGYELAPFASEALAAAGKVAGKLGHRLTTHPGQFTQIGSPRKEVVKASVRDLEYHNELLSLLKLPEQQNRDAVMILHMGGVYGDKGATLDRFRENYVKLSPGVKARLVLENDDVAWSVHDLLPICEELNIPLVLDYHHHNIIFDPSVREGTHDIIGLYDRIRRTWTRKGITQKMHYSESTFGATMPRDRRKHSARVRTLPPCAQDMDLMIEAKDKEQAVFELMRTFKLPGWDTFNDIIPHERDDEPRKAIMKKKKPGNKQKKTPVKKNNIKKNGNQKAPANGLNHDDDDEDNDYDHSIDGGVNGSVVDDDVEVQERIVAPEDIGMGGKENRVYWPETMEEWLKPKKREVKKQESPPGDKKTPTKKGATASKKKKVKTEDDEDDEY